MMEMQQVEYSVRDLAAQVQVNGIYEHYRVKGQYYKVLMVACNVEDLSWWVIYEALYDNPVSKIWSRKVEDFLAVGSWKEGAAPCPRFTYVKQAE